MMVEASEELVKVFQDAWYAADAKGLVGGRTQAGLNAVLAKIETAQVEHDAEVWQAGAWAALGCTDGSVLIENPYRHKFTLPASERVE